MYSCTFFFFSVFIYIVLFRCSKIPLLLSPFCLRNYLSHSFMADLLAANSLSFPSSENILIFPILLKRIFMGLTQFWVDSHYFSAFETILYHFLVVSMVSGEKSAEILIVSRQRFPHCFSFATFKVFLICL